MPDMPGWLASLVETVAENMTAHGPTGPLGVRYRSLDEFWDVLVYSLPIEMIGGAHDGGVAAPSFALDVHGLQNAFSRLESVQWEAHGTDAPPGPCIALRGVFEHRALLLRVLAFAPADVEPGIKVNATGKV